MGNETDYAIDWTNVNLKDAYMRDQNMLDPYSFSTLLLEIHCGVGEINKETVTKQFEDILESKIRSAREVFKNNLENIISEAQAERDLP